MPSQVAAPIGNVDKKKRPKNLFSLFNLLSSLGRIRITVIFIFTHRPATVETLQSSVFGADSCEFITHD
ncbi:MAG: hypothetical protein HXS53_05250 [Theionarchaea archaeon]|nr:hypothetical protein [Theionarchaea archaeon]